MTSLPAVLVVGSLNMDLVVRVASHPAPGDTVLGEDVATFPGGKGANQAAAAAKAGAAVKMLGRVGSDAYGAQLKGALEALGVDVSLTRVHDGPSGVAFITVDAAGENMIVVSSGANRQLGKDALEPDLLDGVGAVLMQLESPLETVTELAARAHAAGVPVILNGAPAQILDDALLVTLDTLIVNEGEAALLAGVDSAEDAEDAAERLGARGVENIVVTLGAQGVLWAGTGGRGRLGAHSVEVVDTTAAGDAFCGAFAAALVEGRSLEDAVAFANAAGALATTRAGAQPSLPTRAAIERLLEQAS